MNNIDIEKLVNEEQQAMSLVAATVSPRIGG